MKSPQPARGGSGPSGAYLCWAAWVTEFEHNSEGLMPVVNRP